MARAATPPKNISELIDMLDVVREDLLCIQRSLEKMEPTCATTLTSKKSSRKSAVPINS